MSSLKLSEKYGVNPSVAVCFYCGQDTGELILAGKMEGDEEAPHRAVWSKQPCRQCQELMAQGIMFISVDESKTTDPQNPYRSGAIVVVKEEAVRRLVTPPELVEQICRQRVAFVPDEAWDLFGLPRENFPPRAEPCPD